MYATIFVIQINATFKFSKNSKCSGFERSSFRGSDKEKNRKCCPERCADFLRLFQTQIRLVIVL